MKNGPDTEREDESSYQETINEISGAIWDRKMISDENEHL